MPPSLWETLCANKTFDYTFVLHNCLCLIKICAYSHVTIKQRAVVDFEVMFISVSILKASDSTEKWKRFSSQSSLQAFKRYICIYKEWKGHLIKENQQYVAAFSSKEICLKSKWRNLLHSEKRKSGYKWTGKWWLWHSLSFIQFKLEQIFFLA